MENLQQFQQAIQQPVVPTSMSGANQFQPLGKIVESIDIVKTTDIPMDGNSYYFPKADGSEIYSKAWMPNGQTRILAFKPILENETSNLSESEESFKFDVFEDALNDIQKEIKALNEKIDKINKVSSTKTKKESVADE